MSKLTNIVKGAAVQFDTTNTYAIERQAAIPICYGSAESAWNAALAYNGTASNYPGKIFDNVGWVRGTKSANGGWGAHLWVLQNKITFQASTSAWWSTTNGIPVAISNVMVGSLGDYQATSNVADISPVIPSNFPGANYNDSGTYQVDITNVYYELIIPDIWITPRYAVAIAGSSTTIQYAVAGTNIPQGVTWTIIPSGLSSGAVIQASNDWHYAGVIPGNVATNYKVRATSVDNTNFYDQVDLFVINVEIEASKNVLTLKHDRDCNLEVKTVPVDISTDQYKIEIKRTNSATWYTLSTNKTMTPWLANIAGGFHLRGMAKIGGTEYYSTNIVVVNQFPTYTQIEGDTDVRSATDTEWTNTLTDCTETPNQRRERGFWIQVNTTSNIYQHTTTFTGPWVGPTQGASATPGTTPADVPTDPAPNAIGAVYTVACFHTHTPTTYWSTNDYRLVGPSGPLRGDVPFHNSRERVGIVYDYIGDAQGRIYGGHPEGASVQRYQVGPILRPLP